MRALILAACLVAMGAGCMGGGIISGNEDAETATDANLVPDVELVVDADINPDAGPLIAGRILSAGDYDTIKDHDLDRTDIHTGSVVVPATTDDATRYYYLMPDGAYWRISHAWPIESGACTFNINDDTWDLLRADGEYAYDRDLEAWTDNTHYYRLASEGYGSLRATISQP